MTEDGPHTPGRTGDRDATGDQPGRPAARPAAVPDAAAADEPDAADPESVAADYLVDYLGVLLPAPRGSRVRKVLFPDFRAEIGHRPRRARLGLHRAVLPRRRLLQLWLRSHRRLVARISRSAGVPVAERRLPAAAGGEPRGHRGRLPDGVPAAAVAGLSGAPGGVRRRLGGWLPHLRGRAAGDRRGLPAPGGIVALSPWWMLDCTHSSVHPTAPATRTSRLHRIADLAALAAAAPTRTPLESLLDADLSALPPVVGSRSARSRC